MFDLSATHEAIEAYDEAEACFELLMENGDFLAAQAELGLLAALGKRVGIAFGEETSTFNDPQTCAQCIRPGPRVPPPGAELSFVRRLVDQWKKHRAELGHPVISRSWDDPDSAPSSEPAT